MAVAILTMENLEKLSNNLLSLFSSEKYMAAKAAAMCAAKVIFSMVF